MYNILRSISLAIILVFTPLLADDDIPKHQDGVRKIATYTFTGLSASAGTMTILIPANNSKVVYLVGVTMECSVACSLAQNFGGTITSGTPVTPVALNNASPPAAVATILRDASVGSGSALQSWTTTANVPFSLDLTNIAFRGSSSAQSYTISTGTISGNAKVSLIWVEKY